MIPALLCALGAFSAGLGLGYRLGRSRAASDSQWQRPRRIADCVRREPATSKSNITLMRGRAHGG